MDHNKYMTTGEFARRMGVTKNTLFHYDNIGLFLPEIVDTNDYRYYSIWRFTASMWARATAAPPTAAS